MMALVLAFSVAQAAEAQRKKVNCNKPPEVIPPAKHSKDQKQKTTVRGAVAIEVNEDGVVVSAKALSSRGTSAEELESFAKSMKFKPRPGCREFKAVVNVDIGSQ